MLAVNHCHSAFWLGNLKNRDIKGNEILSQATIVEEDGDDADEDNENDSNSLQVRNILHEIKFVKTFNRSQVCLIFLFVLGCSCDLWESPI